tara:strand:+ start:77856 stop:79409 length:1554 start_codon:yes stop_codon:yes gene_type:complete
MMMQRHLITSSTFIATALGLAPFLILPQCVDAQDASDDIAQISEVAVATGNVASSAASVIPMVEPRHTPCCDPPEAAKKPGRPYKGVFYDNDFRYLNDPGYESTDWFDALKGIEPVEDLVIDVGGEYRLRFHDENNMRLNGRDENFMLHRTRLYTDVRYQKRFRAFAEFIDAASFGEELPTRGIYVNRADFLNLFGEVTLLDDESGTLTGRVGRQELQYGSQRLISPLDWANTRRTFDGAKLFWQSDDWNIDGFWTRPVPFGQHVPDDHNFDNPDESQQFYGVFSTYKGCENQTVDLYYLGLQESGAPTTGVSFDTHTIGGRWDGKHENWLWEIEGGVQFGDFAGLDQNAGFCTVGLGHKFADLPWTPTFHAFYDWASGDSDPTDGKRGTFNQLFPFGHFYMGFTDLVARQNIRDTNFRLTLKPCDKATLILWWHIYQLDEARDALYNAGSGVVRSDPTGAAGTDVGNELDLLLKVNVDQHADLLFGYSRLFAGDFIKRTGVGQDVDFFYTQFSYKF